MGKQNKISIKNNPINKKSIGLGDTVSKLTTALGIKPCDSCIERKNILNKTFSFLKAVKRDISQEEIKYLKNIEVTKKIEDIQKFVVLFNDIFGARQKPCQCPQVMADLLSKLLMQVEYQNIK